MVTVEKLLSHTVKVGECLEWTRCFNTDGYPRMGWKGKGNGKVHRILMELLGHDIADLVVRHKCDNPKCINPDHLIVGTFGDNARDKKERNRQPRTVFKEHVVAVRALQGELSNIEIGNLLGLDPRRVSEIINGRRGDDGRISKSDR